MSCDRKGVNEFVLDVLILLAIAVCSTCVLLLKSKIADFAQVLDFDPVTALRIYLTKKVAFVGVVVLVMLLVLLYKALALALAAWAARKGGNPVHILISALLSSLVVPEILWTDDGKRNKEEQEVLFIIPPYLLLVLVWWNDGTKPLMAILPVFGWLIVRLQPQACILPFCWLTLLQGFSRILDGSGTATESCLFVWTLSYSSRLLYFNILLLFKTPPWNLDLENKWVVVLSGSIFIVIGLWSVIWSIYRAGKLAWNIYLKVFAPLTWHMKEFLAVDLLSMITFTCCCSQISGHGAVLVGCAYLCVGWLVTGGLIYIFHMPHENQEELDQRFQTACKISVVMDVGGKFYTYWRAFSGAHNTFPHCVMIVEALTFLYEAMVKFHHARRAHAREATPDSLDNPLLDAA